MFGAMSQLFGGGSPTSALGGSQDSIQSPQPNVATSKSTSDTRINFATGSFSGGTGQITLPIIVSVVVFGIVIIFIRK